MKLIIDVQDKKAGFFLELIRSFSFVKAKPLTQTDEQTLIQLAEAVENMIAVKKGNLKARPAKDLLNEL